LQESFPQIDLGAEPLWPLDFKEHRPSAIQSIAIAIAVGAGFGVLCAAGRLLAQNTSHIATFWAADGVLTAFLLSRPKNRWWTFLVAAWLGDIVSILLFRSSIWVSGSLAFCHLAEVLIAALLLKKAIQQNRDLASPGMMARVLLFAILLAPAISALLASAYYRLVFGAHFWQVFGKWFPAHAIGMGIMMPLTLAIWDPNLPKLFDRNHIHRTVGILLLILGVSIGIFEQTHYSLRFLWLPLLMLVVFEVGMLGAVMAIFEVLLVGALYTLHGRGLLWIDKGSTLQGNILLLQSAILVLLLSVVPFAAILERQQQLRTRLRLGMKRYQLLADNSRDIVVLANLEGRRLYVSPAIHDVLGWTQEEWTNQDAADNMHWEDRGAFQRMLKELLHGEDRRTFRYRTRHKNGQYLWMEASIRALPDETTGKPNALVANVRDISERVDSERKLAEAHIYVQQQAQRDSLTQLANRRRFDEVLEKEWRRGRRTGKPLALLMVDIDHFKRINDTCGHRAGDQCLQTLAAILLRVARRPSDVAARYGGEEFTVLLPDVNLTAAQVVAEGLCLQVREQLFNAGIGRSLALTVSVGVAALVPDKNTRADALVEAADQALYAAKQAGRNRIMPEYERQEAPETLLRQLQ
jgi:diguanylate cyclase (GGDEF)-like protein/PAS domain S-box-containing protein